jgi:hypothetical protein
MSEGMNSSDRDILADLRRIIRAVNLEGKRVEKTYGDASDVDCCGYTLRGASDFHGF